MIQPNPVVQPNPTDSLLKDFATNIQNNNLVPLFNAAHQHISKNGPITSIPKVNDGNVGDIYVAVFTTTQVGAHGTFVAGSYLFFKTASGWFGIGPGTLV
jgi:hypothetical protein